MEKGLIIHYHKTFQKHLLRYRHKRKAIDKAIDLFQKDPAEPKLKTHKLTQELTGYWSFSIDYHLRILFRFVSKNTVLFLDIGTHSIYR